MPPDRSLAAYSLLGLLLISSSFSCSANHPADQGTAAARSASGISYTDMIGRPVVLARHPMRIVSLAPSVTEVLYLVGADDRLIGVTTHCDWPEDAKRKPKLGSLLNPGYERILAARPDLILASTAGNDQAAVYKLAELGLPVFVTAPRSVAGIFEATLEIGRITDRLAEAERLVAASKIRLQEIRRRLAGLPPVHAFFITWFDPLLAPGRKTFENDVLSLANIQSISASSDEFYPRYSLEQVVAQNPEVILTVAHPGNPLPDLREMAGWRNLEAVQQGRVYILNEVLQHPSPRFVDGVEELASKVHPERFR
jgi:iron complex transport system substrate-binding protein